MEKLLKAQTLENSNIPKRLVQEVPTRWNSTYHMVERFVELQKFIRLTVAVLNKNLPVICNEEWQLFEELIKVLKPFYDATRSMSGEKYVTGSSVIVMTRCLLTACERLLNQPFYPAAVNVILALKTGLETRFAGVEKSVTFAVCTFLDPRYKMTVFANINDAQTVKKSARHGDEPDNYQWHLHHITKHITTHSRPGVSSRRSSVRNTPLALHYQRP